MTDFVAGARRALRACLWARPLIGAHAAGTGGNAIPSSGTITEGQAALYQS